MFIIIAALFPGSFKIFDLTKTLHCLCDHLIRPHVHLGYWKWLNQKICEVGKFGEFRLAISEIILKVHHHESTSTLQYGFDLYPFSVVTPLSLNLGTKETPSQSLGRAQCPHCSGAGKCNFLRAIWGREERATQLYTCLMSVAKESKELSKYLQSIVFQHFWGTIPQSNNYKKDG